MINGWQLLSFGRRESAGIRNLKMDVEPLPQANWTRNTLFALAAVGLNQVVRMRVSSTPAILGLLTVCAVVLWGALGSPVRKLEALGPTAPIGILASGVMLQFAQLFLSALRSYPDNPMPLVGALLVAGIVVCAAVTLLAVTGWAPSGNAWFAATLVVFFCLGIAYLQTSLPPQVDVYEFQQRGSAALLSGHSPYAADYPNIYDDGTAFYSPALYSNGRLQVGLPYPPFSLFLCLPGFLLAGDVRYSHLVAIALSGLLIGLAREGLLSKLAALLLVFSPGVFWIVHEGWTEPFAILLTSAVLARRGADRSRFWMLGLLMASKQYMLLAAPAAWLLTSDRSWRTYGSLILRSVAVFLIVTLPLAIWDFGAFFRSVVMFQFLQPFRPDSFSFPAWLVRIGLPQPPVWPAFAAVGIAGYFLFKRLQPSPSNFAASLAVMYLLFFSLNKQAFANYYFLVEACLCWAIVAPDSGPLSRSAQPSAGSLQTPA